MSLDNMLLQALAAGYAALMEYLSAHVLTSIIPAFFLAGAISAFLKKDSIVKYLGPGVRRTKSYGVAAVAGGIIAVCSCTVLPLFTSIYRRGAGIGPAITFLFSGPAINVIAIIVTASVLGLDMGVVRAVAAVSMSIFIGVLMSLIFQNGGSRGKEFVGAAGIPETGGQGRPRIVTPVLFLLLLAILLTASSLLLELWIKIPAVLGMVAATAFLIYRYYDRDERQCFGRETWWLFKRIFPILVLGSFVSGVIGYLIPIAWLQLLMGSDSLPSCLLASGLGALLYMPTLLEVPIVGNLFGYLNGTISAGPALALLLAGPTISLPSMLVLWRTIGTRKAAAYIILVLLVSAAMGVALGPLIGWL